MDKPHPKFVLFLDNRFKFHFDQVLPFFESGFFPAQDTLLISRFHWSSYFRTRKLAKELGLRTFFYRYLKDIPKLDGTFVFYPYNGQANARMVLNREARHIFLTHGESNKKASINRLVRIYDHVLAAGDIACDRYRDFGVFHDAHAREPHVFRLGSSLIQDLPDALCDPAGQPCLLYMPTWEGGLDEEDFSSACSPESQKIILAISRKLGLSTLVVQAHPNLGARRTDYRSRFREMLIALAKEGLEIFVAPSERVDKTRGLYQTLLRAGAVKLPEAQRFSARYALVDVSASESMAANRQIPSAVLCRSDKPFFAPASYLGLRKEVLLSLTPSAWHRQLEFIGSKADVETQQAFFAAAISYSDESLRGMTHAQRLAWLEQKLLGLPAQAEGIRLATQ